jgi:uncharacterized protein (TIGR02391 family)
MFQSLSSLVPNAADLLSLEVEKLAGVLLAHLNSYEGLSGNSVYHRGRFNLGNFIGSMKPTGYMSKPEYGDKQPEVTHAIMEAWAWLESEAFLVRDPEQGADWYFLSRRAQRLKTHEDFDAYRKASLLPRGQLHPLIASEVYPAFLRGKYDTAIFEAFREVEVVVREAGKFGPNNYGPDLMRAAFRPADKKGQAVTPGPLTDTQLPAAEQEAMANLFAGAIGLYKKPA